jgi:hypothetical protein
VQIDNSFVETVAYGTSRPDTQGVCGDTNNGFVDLFNWNRLGAGAHEIVALADGVEFARQTFTVTDFGQEFLTGQSGSFTFPFAGHQVTVEWRESLQDFTIVNIQ